jgi:hypothetical protein
MSYDQLCKSVIKCNAAEDEDFDGWYAEYVSRSLAANGDASRKRGGGDKENKQKKTKLTLPNCLADKVKEIAGV